MSRFSTIERVRKLKEEESLRELALAQRDREKEIQKKMQILSQIHAGLDRRESLGTEPTKPSHFRAEEDFIVGNKYRLVYADRAIVRAQKKVNLAMQKYIKAKQELKKFEKLREREYQKYIETSNRDLIRESDDMMVMRDRFRGEF